MTITLGNNIIEEKQEGMMEVEYVGAKVIAELWGWKQSKVTAYCRAGKIYGAEQDKKGCPWRIPIDALKPDEKEGRKAK